MEHAIIINIGQSYMETADFKSLKGATKIIIDSWRRLSFPIGVETLPHDGEFKKGYVEKTPVNNLKG